MQSIEEGKVVVEALEGSELAQRLGRQKVREEERINTRREIAEYLLRDGFDLDLISKITKLSEEQIKELANGEANSN